MAYLNTQKKKHWPTDCLLTQNDGERTVVFSLRSKHDCSLKCFLKGVRVGPNVRLLSRVRYTFPTAVPATASDALTYADEVNERLRHSQVFVVKDIDGDGHHYLRMDTVLQVAYGRKNISGFLDCVTEDVNILVKYFNHSLSDTATLRVVGETTI